MKQGILFVFYILLSWTVYSCSDDKEKVYLVEETNYIHSSKEGGTCKFMDQAREKGYSVKKVKISSAPYYKYKMCRLCFSPQMVQEYDKKLKARIESESRLIRESERKDSLINSVSEEVREAIIEDYLENQAIEDDEYYPDDDRPHGRYY